MYEFHLCKADDNIFVNLQPIWLKLNDTHNIAQCNVKTTAVVCIFTPVAVVRSS